MEQQSLKRESAQKGSDLVLVVDDEASLRAFLVDLFQTSGWEVCSAASGEEALPFLEERNPIAAFIDLVLPGMNGLDLLAEIKRKRPKTEVILMTSHASLETAIEALDKGAYGYLRKPFEGPEEILRLFERAVEKRRLTEENERLQSDLERRNGELTAANQRLASLIEAGRAMSAIHEIRELLDFFIEVVVSELQVDRASLMLVDKAGEMKIVASRGIRDEVVRNVRIRMGEGIAGWVAEKGKPILVRDVRNHSRLQDHDHIGYQSHSFISAPIILSIPIKFQEKVLGVINVTNKRSGQTFSDDDLAFLYSLAGQAAVAIEGASHFEELKKSYETLRSKEEQIVASERLNALGQMASGVAHDFNNLLNGILGRAELLLQECRSNRAVAPVFEEELKRIEQLSIEGAETIRRIQEFTGLRKDTPFVATDLNEVIREAVEMTRPKWKGQTEAEGLRIDVEYQFGVLPILSAARNDLMQVFGNLIFNAVEAMPRGGKLIFRTTAEAQALIAEVIDEGIGIAGEVRKKIFEPFFTTKQKGKGLGLSIVHGIVSRHGGTVGVQSEVGRGVPPGAGGERRAGSRSPHRRQRSEPSSLPKDPANPAHRRLRVDRPGRVGSLCKGGIRLGDHRPLHAGSFRPRCRREDQAEIARNAGGVAERLGDSAGRRCGQTARGRLNSHEALHHERAERGRGESSQTEEEWVTF